MVVFARMQVAPNCFAVTGLGYVPPWCVNAGFNDVGRLIDTVRKELEHSIETR